MQLLPLFCVLASQSPSVAAHPIAPGDQMHPTAAITSAGFVIAYVDRRGGQSEVVYVQSPDLEVYSAPIPLGPKGGTETIRPHADSNFDRMVVVWADATSGDHDVYAATSRDRGFTFDPPVLAAGGPGGQVDPRVTVLEDGAIAIAFQDSAGSTGADRGVTWQIRYVTSSDGATFTPADTIPGQPSDRFNLFPAISSRGQNVLVTWVGDGIMASESTDGGLSFSDAARIDGGTPGALLSPRVARTDGGWLVAFGALVDATEQRLDGIAVQDARYIDLFATTSTGAAFSEPVSITLDRTLNQMEVDLHELDGIIGMTWVDHTSPGVRKVRLQLSYDNARTFDLFLDPISDNADDVEVKHPVFTSLGDLVMVTWEDARGGTFDVRTAVVGR